MKYSETSATTTKTDERRSTTKSLPKCSQKTIDDDISRIRIIIYTFKNQKYLQQPFQRHFLNYSLINYIKITIQQ